MRRPRLSLDLLRGFRAAARHLSFTSAARELHVTPSAVSREIATLESQLGAPLFHRANRALQLTAAGVELARAAGEAIDVVDAAVARVVGGAPSLGVTTTDALASTWLVPRLPGFARDHAGHDVRIAASNSLVDLEREHLDIAIRYVPPGWPVPTGERLVDYHTFPVCSPELAKRRPLRTPADFVRHVRLDFETVLYGRLWSDWDRWYATVGVAPVAPASTMRFSHYDQVIEAAVKGAGIAIGKLPHLASYLGDGKLAAPFGRSLVASIGGFDLVVAPSAKDRPDVLAFIDWLRGELRRDADTRPAPSKRSVARTRGAHP